MIGARAFRRALGAWLCAAMLGASADGVQAQADPGQIARRAVAQLEQAGAALAAAEGSRDRIAALTDTIRAYERGLSALREGVRQANQREAEIRAVFETENRRLAGLIGALQTMQGSPEALLLLHPDGALGTARSGMILSDVTPALLGQVDSLRRDLAEIASLRALEARAAETLGEALAGIQKARTTLSLAISDRTDLPQRLTDNAEQMARLAESAQSLEGFAAELEALPTDDGLVAPDFAFAKGDLMLPVRGTVVAGFKAADAAGVARPGLLLATAPGALVTTPWPATIRYRGPLADYENVMILEPAAGYLLVLAGLATVYGETGQVIPADTPVGLMGGGADGLEGFMTQGAGGDGQDPRETLYLELREGQGPVDPAPWFRIDEE
ncbi:murein hydrolase activator EnvC family protein [Oceaniglobus indicus]|uniref:murein hydrolase activator EnvC family protein n=1 Tax=Oceaniglobus indicus TaxID=2047749 RepID=UPI001F4EFFA9|nr:peptidase M23 [Oceaniglobus indicus]